MVDKEISVDVFSKDSSVDVERLKLRLNSTLYTMQAINIKLDKAIVEMSVRKNTNNNSSVSFVDAYGDELLVQELTFAKNLINETLNVMREEDFTNQVSKINEIKEKIIKDLQESLLEQRDAYLTRCEIQKAEANELKNKHKIEREIYELATERNQKYLTNLIEGRDFIENFDENPAVTYSYQDDVLQSKLGKDYLHYYNHAKTLNEIPSFADFREFQLARQNEVMTKKELNKKDYTKYNIFGLKPHYEKRHISKRHLPTEVFRYLFYYNILNEEDIKFFSTNQFGRTFEAKMGDILVEEDVPKEAHRIKRYNLLDFSKKDFIKESVGEESMTDWNCGFTKKIYVSTEWDKSSIDKFIEYIQKYYSDYISIGLANR